MDCSGQLSSVGMGAFIGMAPWGCVSFLAAQFTAIRMKQKGRWSALSFEAIEADRLRQSMMGE
jgi:hypothetical protein